MAEASDTLGIPRQNLIDAGCGEALTETCITLAGGNQWKRILPLLSKQKSDPLDAVHHGQKQIDCLVFCLLDPQKIYSGGAVWKQNRSLLSSGIRRSLKTKM